MDEDVRSFDDRHRRRKEGRNLVPVGDGSPRKEIRARGCYSQAVCIIQPIIYLIADDHGIVVTIQREQSHNEFIDYTTWLSYQFTVNTRGEVSIKIEHAFDIYMTETKDIFLRWELFSHSELSVTSTKHSAKISIQVNKKYQLIKVINTKLRKCKLKQMRLKLIIATVITRMKSLIMSLFRNCLLLTYQLEKTSTMQD